MREGERRRKGRFLGNKGRKRDLFDGISFHVAEEV